MDVDQMLGRQDSVRLRRGASVRRPGDEELLGQTVQRAGKEGARRRQLEAGVTEAIRVQLQRERIEAQRERELERDEVERLARLQRQIEEGRAQLDALRRTDGMGEDIRRAETERERRVPQRIKIIEWESRDPRRRQDIERESAGESAAQRRQTIEWEPRDMQRRRDVEGERAAERRADLTARPLPSQRRGDPSRATQEQVESVVERGERVIAEAREAARRRDWARPGAWKASLERTNSSDSDIENALPGERTSRSPIEEIENTGGADVEGATGEVPEVAMGLETAEIVELRNQESGSREPHDRGLDPCTNISSNSSNTLMSDAARNLISDSETVLASSASPISAPHSLPATVILPWPYVLRSQSSSVTFNMSALAHFPFATHGTHSQHAPTHRRHWYFKHLSSLFILTLSLATLYFMLYVKNINIGSSFEAAAFVLVAGAMMTKVVSSCVWERPGPVDAARGESMGSGLEMRSVPSLGSMGGSESNVSLV